MVRITKQVRTFLTEIGRKGGSKTAKRGSAYFRKIQALRKDRRGGQPRKKKPKK